MSKDIKGFGPSPIEPGGHSDGLAARVLGFVGVPILWVLISAFMTIISFMIMKVEQGETWGTLWNWWCSLIMLSPMYTMIFPSIVCIGIIIILVKPWSR